MTLAASDQGMTDHTATEEPTLRTATGPAHALSAQRCAADLLGTRIEDDGGDDIADWAEIGQDGIRFGLRLSVDLLGGIVAGPLGDRFEDEYREALTATEPDFYNELRDFIGEAYGAELRDDDDRFEDLVFVVDYEPGGARASTIEYMGERANAETGLRLAGEEAATGKIVDRFAARLGYTRGPWVKS